MAKRITRKSTAESRRRRRYARLLAVQNTLGLPGAVFFGTVHSRGSITNQHFENVEYALRLDCIRADFEQDACEEALWADCRAMGFDSKEIGRFAMNPGLITSCGYMPIPLR